MLLPDWRLLREGSMRSCLAVRTSLQLGGHMAVYGMRRTTGDEGLRSSPPAGADAVLSLIPAWVAGTLQEGIADADASGLAAPLCAPRPSHIVPVLYFRDLRSAGLTDLKRPHEPERGRYVPGRVARKGRDRGEVKAKGLGLRV